MATYMHFAFNTLDGYLAGKTIKALLVKSTYVYDTSHQYLSDINATSTEVTAGGYSRQTLTSVATSFTAGLGVYVAAADINFGTFTQPGVLGPIFYIDTGTAGTSEVICADVDAGAVDIDNAVAAIYRIDPDQGFLLARL